ncbi:hypothetical protein VNO78_14023 [Psophocarpus tetragonolobus]|uniref:Secreted protein n=1 Tax=Psophocarpus tetragonolobus TaxID=3891 RepID=A0AAN9SSK7_PSOTE
MSIFWLVFLVMTCYVSSALECRIILGVPSLSCPCFYVFQLFLYPFISHVLYLYEGTTSCLGIASGSQTQLF